MKKIFLILFVLQTVQLFSQQGKVNYGFINSLGIGYRQGDDYNATLVFDNKKSYYVTAKDSLEKEQVSFIPKVSKEKGGVTTISFGLVLNEIGNQVHIDTEKDSIWSNINSINQIFIKEKKPQIDWKITTETKQIGKFTCSKATTHFRGRDYTAWFTMAIPVKFGPWKLHGLPGLILEAYDKDKYVYWYFKNIVYPLEKNINLDNMFLYYPDSKFNSYVDFKKEQKEVVEKNYENTIIKAKKFPEIVVQRLKLSMFFIECEEE